MVLAPGDIDRSVVEKSRRQGASDAERPEVNQVAACFNYSNRVIGGLGAQLGDEQIGFYVSSTGSRNLIPRYRRHCDMAVFIESDGKMMVVGFADGSKGIRGFLIHLPHGNVAG